MVELTLNNLELYAAQNYTNNSCKTMQEFRDDLRKANEINRLLNRFISGKNVDIYRILNNFIMFTNAFKMEASKNILRMKCDVGSVNAILKYFKIIDTNEYNVDLYLVIVRAVRDA